jgi:hypothetical protein
MGSRFDYDDDLFSGMQRFYIKSLVGLEPIYV